MPNPKQIISMQVFVNGDLDWNFYVNAMLDQPGKKTGGKPFRHGIENSLVLRIVKDSNVAIVHKIIAENIKQGIAYERMHKNNRIVFDKIAEVLMRNLNLRNAEPKRVHSNLDAFGFDVSGVNGAAFILFTDKEIAPSPIIKCSECSEEYDLSKNTQMVTDDDISCFFSSLGANVVGGNGRRSPDLLQKTDSFSAKDRLKAKNRIEALRIDPSYRWSCGKCKKEGMGYPGSFIAFSL